MTSVQPEPTPTSVYRYFDEQGILLYVGITSRGMLRNREHNGSKDWWPYVAAQEVEHFTTRDEAHAREIELIADFRPPFNKHHNPSYGHFRDQYMTLRSMPVSFDDGVDLMRVLKRRLPLDVVDWKDNTYYLRTRLEHASIGCRLDYEGMVKVSTQTQKGHVRRVRNIGPLSIVQLHKGYKPNIEAVYARIKAAPDKTRPRFIMTSIEIELSAL